MSAAGDKIGRARSRLAEVYERGRKFPMVRWYDPRLLLRTGIRAVTAAIFGLYADRRELQAALAPSSETGLCKQHDYSRANRGREFWLDYVADPGDGWNSAHSVARALAAPALEAGGEEVPRGRILVMGGDEVYPDPSREAYRWRLIEPYRQALPEDLNGEDGPPPDLFAIPGNHDWYDGLNAFSGLFLRSTHGPAARQGRRIGGWQTQQSRSYFAIKLPKRWWLWGIDDQLNAYIDRPQIDYFACIAKQCMKKGDRVILCVAEPAWVQADLNRNLLGNLKYVAGVIREFGGELRLVLSGDLHHYARYQDADTGRQLITAGGGGAFLHPTHVLPDEVSIDWPREDAETFTREEVYPSAGLSRALAWKNLLLPFTNMDFAAAIGAGYALLVWFLESRNFGSQLLGVTQVHGSMADAAARFLWTLSKSPEFAALALLALVLMARASAARRGWSRFVLGGTHWLMHMAALIAVYCGAVQFNSNMLGILPVDARFMPLLLAEMIVFGGLLGAFVFGLNLLVMLNIFRLHWTDAFSSLRIEDYKNFLRLHIGTDGALTVYPMKIEKVRCDIGPAWKRLRTPSRPELIEPPIRIE